MTTARRPTLHLMCGLPCAGKTTRAMQLERELDAVRLTPDEWHVRLFGHDVAHPDHDRRHGILEDQMWKIAATILGRGIDVILDFGFWSRIERDDYRERAAASGAATVVHFLDAPRDVLRRRLEIRNELVSDTVAKIPLETLERWCSLFEPPDADELAR